MQNRYTNRSISIDKPFQLYFEIQLTEKEREYWKGKEGEVINAK